MFRRQRMAIMVAILTLFPLTAYTDARVTAAGVLVAQAVHAVRVVCLCGRLCAGDGGGNAHHARTRSEVM